ncbi:MAG: iron ABC transporter permease [Planctomycetota bacterium]
MTRAGKTWLVLVASLAAVCVASLLVGEGDLSDPEMRATFLRLRAWRLANAVLAGAALAGAGVLVQGLFRNPLASPSILGTSAGASLGGIFVLVLWNGVFASRIGRWLPPELVLPVGCLAGAWLSLIVLLAVTGKDAGIVTVLLTGFILSSLFLSIGGLLTSIAQESWQLGRAVVAFTLGGVDAKGPRHAALALPMVGITATAALGWSRHLDLLLSGEDEARSLGVDVTVVRRWVIVWAATLTAAAVAIGGNVAFVGLVVPHALRPFVGVEHRRLLPAALIGGAAFLAGADVVTRIIPTRGVVPLGVVTGLVGAPLFLVLLARASREGRIA